jgi:predicted lipoprotein with Yx(FWY)xxD motif
MASGQREIELSKNLPPMPEDISVFIENGGIVFRADTRSLYVFDKDTHGKSHCDAVCAQTWTPLEPSPQARAVGDWSIIQHDDASKQWAYKGKPVYTYSQDVGAQATGDGLGGAWHRVKP